ncbi:hypothetical protein GIB67_024669 [Kingdonia uniflora]|uniref:Auxin-responsive protein n=1 Tax=Kingdonia uniflora TaxID=39325 RepID=A0A7J7LPF7_9MAGN|nr:hypothetical protein GIB67_024669 [Kingdonia uniflora]
MEGGGGLSSGGSTVTKVEMVEQDYSMGLSSEVSSYHLNQNDSESELELGLGLSLGGGSIKSSSKSGLLSLGGGGSSNSYCAPVSGTKRAAVDSIVREVSTTPSNGVSQVVGWPPIKPCRIHSLVNKSKIHAAGGDGANKVNENSRTDNAKTMKTINITSNAECKENGRVTSSFFVKVNMDGIPIGRKVDLSAHSTYKTLAQTLEDMFHGPTTAVNTIRSCRYTDLGVEVTKPSKLLDGSSDFVLTYEDKEGDWMLVGDVPWGMFLNTVKRLRVMRTSEANGFGPKFEESGERQRKKLI